MTVLGANKPKKTCFSRVSHDLTYFSGNLESFRKFPELFRKFPGISGNFLESAFPEISGNFPTLGVGDRAFRGNWRPITVLNVDYKILVKALANRLEAVMTILVHHDQTSSVPGRTIQDSLLHVMSVIDYASESNADVMILSLDHKAAFDMVEWNFIFKTMAAMNFGNNFIKMLQCMYKPGSTQSRVIVNGHLSEPFYVYRGVRQGCPLSPLIYVITAEVIAHYIRATRQLTGIPLYGTNTRITKFADDTSVFLTNFNEIRRVFEIFDQFRLASGSRLKQEKTQLLLLGNMRNMPLPAAYHDFVVDKLKIYGLWVDSLGFSPPENWNKCEETIAKLETRFPSLWYIGFWENSLYSYLLSVYV